MSNGIPAPRFTDHTRAVGTAGTMTIRDHGADVEFLISCGDGATVVGNYVWSGNLPTGPVGGSTSLPGGFGTRSLGRWPLATSATVTFHQNATGTQGLGGAADHSAYISRGTPPPTATAPPAPTMRPIDPATITATSMVVQFDSNGDGGAAVSGWDLQRATDAAFTQGVFWQLSYGTTTDTDLAPGTTYYYRARGVNPYGPGGWAQAVSARTLAPVYVSDGSAWDAGEIYVDDGTTTKPATLYISDGSAWRASG